MSVILDITNDPFAMQTDPIAMQTDEQHREASRQFDHRRATLAITSSTSMIKDNNDMIKRYNALIDKKYLSLDTATEEEKLQIALILKQIEDEVLSLSNENAVLQSRIDDANELLLS